MTYQVQSEFLYSFCQHLLGRCNCTFCLAVLFIFVFALSVFCTFGLNKINGDGDGRSQAKSFTFMSSFTDLPRPGYSCD